MGRKIAPRKKLVTISPLSRKALSIEESKTLALSARARKMKAEGIDVVSLTAGEPDFTTPQIVKDAGIRAINENFTKYTANAGIPELLKAIARKFQVENNLMFDPSQIIVSNGAKHSIYNALQVLCNRGDEVLIPSPYWVSYPEMVKLVDAIPIVVKTSETNQFKMTPAQLKKHLTKKTKALILNSPCNPTGAVYSQEELEAFGAVLAKNQVFVISDEIYEKVVYDGQSHFSIGSIPEMRDKVVTINGVSKAYSMTGWRIGYAGASRAIVEAMDKIQGQITSNASSVSQRAALAALTNDLSVEIQGMVGQFDQRRRFLISAFDALKGISYVDPKGAFYLFFNVKQYLKKSVDGMRINNADDLCEYLLVRHNVAMVPGTTFGDAHWVRISYACSMGELEKGVERIRLGLGAIG
jgi:aspartate aminotransferase